jgi:hypothetical protein
MIDHIVANAIKLAALCGGGILAFAGAEVIGGPDSPILVQGIERMGSFALVAIFVLAVLWGLSRMIPPFLAGIEKAKDQFLAELREERKAREGMTDAFRDMLSAHKNELGAKLDEGNRITRELVHELRARPCQKTDQ